MALERADRRHGTSAARARRTPKASLVSDVEVGSPAQRAGIGRGDVILAGESPAGDHAAGSRAARSTPVTGGGTAFLLILRNGQQSFVTVRKE